MKQLRPHAPLRKFFCATLLLASAFIYSTNVSARAWKGVMPGVSTRNEVIKTLGVPTQDLARPDGDMGLLYQGKTAPEGTKQVQVLFDQAGVVTAIHVFPKTDLNAKQIIETYGKPDVERLNESFKTYYQYKDGLVIYFRDGAQIVNSITFQKSTKPEAVSEEKEAKGQQEGTTSPATIASPAKEARPSPSAAASAKPTTKTPAKP